MEKPSSVAHLYPETAAEALKMWDAGHPVWTVEMGGLGPGYEQCIHLLAFELIRALIAADWKQPETAPARGTAEHDKLRAQWDSIVEPVITSLDKLNGFSGAQTGAAQSLAGRMLAHGWRAGVLEAPQSRRIMVSNHWPRTEQGGGRVE